VIGVCWKRLSCSQYYRVRREITANCLHIQSNRGVSFLNARSEGIFDTNEWILSLGVGHLATTAVLLKAVVRLLTAAGRVRWSGLTDTVTADHLHGVERFRAAAFSVRWSVPEVAFAANLVVVVDVRLFSATLHARQEVSHFDLEPVCIFIQ